MKKFFSFKLLALCSVALAFVACSDDLSNGGPSAGDLTDAGQFKTATFTVYNSDQTRAALSQYWSGVHTCAVENWESILNIPTQKEAEEKGAVDVTNTKYWDEWKNWTGPNNASAYYVPEGYNGALDLNYRISISENTPLYNYGTITEFKNVNFNGTVTFYNAGTLTYTVQSGNRHIVVNTGTLTVKSFNNLGTVYNGGYLAFDNWGNSVDLPNAMNIYSNGEGIVDMPHGGDLKAVCDIHGTLNVTGNVKIQNSTGKYICGIKATGKVENTDGPLYTSNIEANELSFDGNPIYLTKGGHINVATTISITNSGSQVYAVDGSTALVETANFVFGNKNDLTHTFSDNIYFQVSGTVKVDGCYAKGQSHNFNTVADYLADTTHEDEFGLVAGRVNAGNATGTPECGEAWTVGTPDPEPDPEDPTEDPEEDGPKLVEIGSIESPTHDHDADKNDPNRRLSATCIDWDGKTFYVTYHMRGGNYAGDTYDKDGVEGCIETWTLKEDADENTTEIVLGQYMWTNAFDFNHLIIDGNDIVTVGHCGDKGAIIGKLPNTFANFDAQHGNAKDTTYSSEFKFKYLTTEKVLTYEDEAGDSHINDYKNAGDGNCVIKVGDEYLVATFAGYGKVDSEFNRIKDETTGEIAFVSTPYSAKHIIEKGNDIAVLYLNDAPDAPLTATTQSTASIAVASKNDFPANAEVKSLESFVQPVDGKNVIAWNGTNLFACLGKGGLNIDNEVLHFGQEGKEPVNGVAIDDNYIYLATGSQLRVLDVNTKEEVVKKVIPNKSANYIKLAEVDGKKYIAVAFGQAGIKVYRLDD